MATLNFRINDELHARLTELAKANRRSLNEQMAAMLEILAYGKLEESIRIRRDMAQSALTDMRQYVADKPADFATDRLVIERYQRELEAYQNALEIVERGMK